MSTTGSRFLICSFALLLGALFPGCTHVASRDKKGSDSAGIVEGDFEIKAEYYCQNGKTDVRLISGTGNKEIDEVTLQFIRDMTPVFPTLKEGETKPVKFRPPANK